MIADKANSACPACYGTTPADAAKCRTCEYRLSCRYYRLSDRKMDQREHVVSFDAAHEVLECADCEHIPGCEPEIDARQERIGELSRFFRYLLDLDGYSLGIIAEVVAPSEPGRHCTVHRLGELHGCSRQAMHKKLIKLIGSRPELAGLFRNTLYKLTAARRSFLRHRAMEAASK